MAGLNKILLGIIIVLVLVLCVVIYWQKVGFESPYWAVYMDTGDLYFGKLSWFPRFSLSDVYYLQRNPDDQQNPLSLSKFTGAFWGPEDRIYLNEKNIVWKVKLKKDSPVANFIKNPTAQVEPAPASK
jgi:hypothetical protein